MSSPLEAFGSPLCFEVEDASELDLEAPTLRMGQSYQTDVRALDGMQKEALVTGSRSGTTCCLACDEGPYLDGADVAPPPLGYKVAGMIADHKAERQAIAEARRIDLGDVELMLDNYYSISGTALQGTMVGRALPPEMDACRT